MLRRKSKPQLAGRQVVRLGLIQHACGADPRANVAKASAMIRRAARQGARIIVTQELFASTYFCQVEDEQRFALAEPIPGPTSRRLGALAKELAVYLAASLFEKRAAGLYHNTAIMLDPAGHVISKYRKMHIPDDPRFYEKYYFAPGDAPGDNPGTGADAGWQVQRTPHATTGLLVCWDQWYPEAARLTALRGAQILLYPTAIGWYHRETPADRKQQQEAWRTIQRAHAIANGVFVAASNRVGVEDDLEFWGSSFVADPGGTVIAQASGTDEEVLLADCDLGRIEQVRHGWPFLRDRRIDAYGDLTRRYVDEPVTAPRVARGARTQRPAPGSKPGA